MKITTFQKKDFGPGRRKADPTVRVNSNRLNISSYAVQLMGLKKTDKILIHQDDDETSTWYLSISEKGFPLNSLQKNTALMLYNTELAMMILEAFGLTKEDGFNFVVQKEPVEHKKVTYWKLVPQ